MLKETLRNNIKEAIEKLYSIQINSSDLLIVPTKKEYKGDYTLTVFPLASKIKKTPAVAANEIGNYLLEQKLVFSYEVIQGFLNLSISDDQWILSLSGLSLPITHASRNLNNKTVLVEYCSPNTNKPLHLGHIRNILLGSAMANIFKACGYTVKQIQVINDRGIAICKSMLAWQKWGNDETPQKSHIKGDHFVGDYYVKFEKEFALEYKNWQESALAQGEYQKRKDIAQTTTDFFKDYKNYYFNKYSKLGAEARELLLKWEKGDPKTVGIWNQMNQWVFDGFDITFKKLGINFDHVDYESITYLLGKKTVELGIEKGIFYKKDDGSVWIDLSDVGMDQKVVLRSDGTSVYITQDLGTAHMRYDKFKMDKLIYVVADEQDYHFKALFEILKKFKEPYADGLYHLSYGMVELPEGKMKSREGTVVDADDLIDELVKEATEAMHERGEVQEISIHQKNQIIESIALGALKFFMLKVHPKKRMVFNPKESLDFQGQTGPYVQNAYVRIQSILRKATNIENQTYVAYQNLLVQEKELITLLEAFEDIIEKAAEQYDPSEIANYSYALAKAFHKFYHEVPILRSDDQAALQFRLILSKTVGNTLKKSFELLGIQMPERM